MATVATNYLTLADLRGRQDPNGALASIIEQVSRSNQFIEDAMLIEGNMDVGHKHTVRTGLPTPTWRTLYKGIQPTKTTTVQVTDTVGFMEDFTEIDQHEYEIAPDGDMFRRDEDAGKIEAMWQEAEAQFWYGDEATDPEKITGLAARYGELSGAPSSANVFDGAGTTDGALTSIWMVTWHRKATFAFYGKGTNGGLRMENLGLQKTTAPSGGGDYMAYITWLKMQLGVSVGDWRYTARLANIEVADRDDGSIVLRVPLQKMIRTSMPTQKLPGANTVLYMNQATLAGLEEESTRPGANLTIQPMEYFGVMVPSIMGVPIRLSDKLLDTESKVT